MDDFNAYEIDPGEAGYEHEAGGYEEEPYGAEETYDPYELAQSLGIVDEYGEVDEERLADVVDGMYQQQNRQADLGQAQTAHHMDQVARDLENEYPQLRSEAGVASMLEAAAELTGYGGNPDDLLEYTVANPQLVEDAIEHMNGAGIFERLWTEQQREPGVAFFLGSGGGSGTPSSGA
jgi:hypothetical protein